MPDITDNKPDLEPDPPGNVHKTILIIVTVVMVAVPLLLGTLRLLGHL